MATIIHKNKLSFWNKSVGKNIKHYRKQLFIPQYKVANHLKLDKSTVNLYEAGKTNIPVKYLYAISLLFKMEIIDFFKHPEEKFKNLTPNKSKISKR